MKCDSIRIIRAWSFTVLGPERHDSYETLNRIGRTTFQPSAYMDGLSDVGALCFYSGGGGWTALSNTQLLLVALSGLIGISFGDTALFLSLNRLGPRRSAILFAMNAPISAMLGWLVLEEVLSVYKILGILTVFIGVVVAIAFGRSSSSEHPWESNRGPLWIGVLLGVGAATAQAIGSLMVRPVMIAGVDTGTVSAVRVGVAACGLSLVLVLSKNTLTLPKKLLPINTLWKTALSGLVGMAIGVSLIVYALSGGEVGIVTTLAATTPVIMLPIIWYKTNEFPTFGSWIGAALVVGGCAFIFVG